MDKLICYCYEICKLETHRHTLTNTYRHVHKESYIRLDATRNPIATQTDQSSSNKVKAKSHAPLPPTPIHTYIRTPNSQNRTDPNRVNCN